MTQTTPTLADLLALALEERPNLDSAATPVSETEPGGGMAEMGEIARIVSEWRHGPMLSAEALRQIAALAKPASAPAGGGVLAEHLLRIAKVGFGYDITEADRKALRSAASALSSPVSSSPAEAEALQAGVEAWKRTDGGLNADWVAMVLSEDARIEDGKLANPSYLAVKIADAADMPAEVLRLRKALAHIRDHTRETTTATMAIGALSSAPAQEDGSKDFSAHPRDSGQSAGSVETVGIPDRIRSFFVSNIGATRSECAAALGVDRRTIWKHIKRMREKSHA